MHDKSYFRNFRLSNCFNSLKYQIYITFQLYTYIHMYKNIYTHIFTMMEKNCPVFKTTPKIFKCLNVFNIR